MTWYIRPCGQVYVRPCCHVYPAPAAGYKAFQKENEYILTILYVAGFNILSPFLFCGESKPLLLSLSQFLVGFFPRRWVASVSCAAKVWYIKVWYFEFRGLETMYIDGFSHFCYS